jgi:TonB family protein
MTSLRLTPWLLTALLAGCASSTPEPETVPPPVIEVDVSEQPAKASPSDSEVERAQAIAENADILHEPEGEELADVYGEGGFGGEDAGLGRLFGTDGTSGVGGLGLRGGGGIGTIGAGRGFRGLGRATSGPVVAGSSTVKGSLPKEVIRRIVRSRINSIRYCYEKQLSQQPDLQGRIAIKFVIAADGKVTTADVMHGMQEHVDACVQKVVKSMRFPKPDGGGVVTVQYPFIFKAADDASTP